MLVPGHAPMVETVVFVILIEHADCFSCLNYNIVSVFRCSKVEQVFPHVSFLSSRLRSPFCMDSIGAFLVCAKLTLRRFFWFLFKTRLPTLNSRCMTLVSCHMAIFCLRVASCRAAPVHTSSKRSSSSLKSSSFISSSRGDSVRLDGSSTSTGITASGQRFCFYPFCEIVDGHYQILVLVSSYYEWSKVVHAPPCEGPRRWDRFEFAWGC